jgi:hypothetical protein
MTLQNTAAEAVAPTPAQAPAQSVEPALFVLPDELSDVCLDYASGGIIVVCRHNPLG